MLFGIVSPEFKPNYTVLLALDDRSPVRQPLVSTNLYPRRKFIEYVSHIIDQLLRSKIKLSIFVWASILMLWSCE